MKKLLFHLLLLLLASTGLVGAKDDPPPPANWVYSPPKTVGNNVLWVAHVYAGDLFMCTGALVSASVVLAPAHCVVQSRIGGMFAVDRVVLAPDVTPLRNGSVMPNHKMNKTSFYDATSGFKHAVVSVIPHPGFQKGGFAFDVALLVLDRSFETNFAPKDFKKVYFRPALLPGATRGSFCSFWPKMHTCGPAAVLAPQDISTTFYGYDPQFPDGVPSTRFPTFPFRGRVVSSPNVACDFGDWQQIKTDEYVIINGSDAFMTRTGRYETYTCACGEKFGTEYTWKDVPVNDRGGTTSVTSHVTLCNLECVGDSGALLHGWTPLGYVVLGLGVEPSGPREKYKCIDRNIYYVNERYNPGYWGWDGTRPIGMAFIDLAEPNVAAWIGDTLWFVQNGLKTPASKWAKDNALEAKWLSRAELNASRSAFHASMAAGCKRGRAAYTSHLAKCVGKLSATAKLRAQAAFDRAVCGVMAGSDVDRVRALPALVAWARCHCPVAVYLDIATDVVVGMMLDHPWEPFVGPSRPVPQCSGKTGRATFMARVRPDILTASPACGDRNLFDRLVQRAIKPVGKHLSAANMSCTLPFSLSGYVFNLEETDFVPPTVFLRDLNGRYGAW